MDRFGINEPGPPQGLNKKLSESEVEVIAQEFLELFELLEEYAPVWYTEQRHNRALATHRILQKSRGAAT